MANTLEHIERLTSNSAENLIGREHKNFGITGLRRVLLAGGAKSLSVSRFNLAAQTDIAAWAATEYGLAASRVFGSVEVRQGHSLTPPSFEVVYYFGDKDTVASLEVIHDDENLFSDGSRASFNAAKALGFGDIWTDSAFDFADDVRARLMNRVIHPDSRQLELLNENLSHY